MIVYRCLKCSHRLKHTFAYNYTCPVCGEPDYREPVKRSQERPRFYERPTIVDREPGIPS